VVLQLSRSQHAETCLVECAHRAAPRSLRQTRTVIANLTGTNGNVPYELSLPHIMGHEAILLTQKLEQVPFYLRMRNGTSYTSRAVPAYRS
jgi:hypothetical protein